MQVIVFMCMFGCVTSSVQDLDEQLDVAVAAFLDDGGIYVDEGKHEVSNPTNISARVQSSCFCGLPPDEGPSLM